MLCFDKLKIITSINYIKNIDENIFQTNSMSGILQSHKYKKSKPPSLLIMNNYEKNELVIEFTSKILKDNFIHLINKDTIYECFSNINKLGICTLDINNIIHNSKVAKCDPVKDVVLNSCDIKELEKYSKANLTNYNKLECKHYQNGFVINNTASTSRSKIRTTIYNKKKELERAENELFIDSLEHENVIEYYNDKTRIEMNINTQVQIREFLEIEDNQLMNVLNSTADPISTLLSKVIKETSVKNIHNFDFTDYKNELVLKDCNYDLKQVEAKVRSLYSKNTSINKVMQPYRELYHRLQANDIPEINLRELFA